MSKKIFATAIIGVIFLCMSSKVVFAEEEGVSETIDVSATAVENVENVMAPVLDATVDNGAEVLTENTTETVLPIAEEIVTQDEVSATDIIVPVTVTEQSMKRNATTPAVVGTEVVLPLEVSSYCEMASKEFNFDPCIVKALVYKESRGNVMARNGSYIGLCQLNPSYFRDTMTRLGIVDAYDPLSNVRICAYSLSQWYNKYGDMKLALECWNKGEGKAVAQHTNEGTYYSRTICNNALVLASVDRAKQEAQKVKDNLEEVQLYNETMAKQNQNQLELNVDNANDVNIVEETSEPTVFVPKTIYVNKVLVG